VRLPILRTWPKEDALPSTSLLTEDTKLSEHFSVQEDDLGKFAEARNAPRGASLPFHAQSLRLAARLNASRITDEEHASLIRERAKLVKRKFVEGLSKAEEIRLEYVRWSRDRIEDAKHGAALDTLEGAVMKYQDALRELQDLRLTLQSKLR
jgi:hypothetical protein